MPIAILRKSTRLHVSKIKIIPNITLIISNFVFLLDINTNVKLKKNRKIKLVTIGPDIATKGKPGFIKGRNTRNESKPTKLKSIKATIPVIFIKARHPVNILKKQYNTLCVIF